MEASVVIAEMDGWEESYGVGVENDVFKAADKPRFRIGVAGFKPEADIPASTSRSLHNQHRTRRKMHQPVRPAADHAAIQLRMTARTDNEQIDFQVAGKVDDVAHRVPRQYMSFELHLAFFGHLAGPIDHGMKATGGDPGFFSYFFNEFGDVGNFLDRDHMELRTHLFGDPDGQCQRMECVI
jgi:hypothetical protein